jgi:hypothetical protein
MPLKTKVPPGADGDDGQRRVTSSPGVVMIAQEEEAVLVREAPQRLEARAVETLSVGPVAGAV